MRRMGGPGSCSFLKAALLGLGCATAVSCQGNAPPVNLYSAALLNSTVCLDFSQSVLHPDHQEVIRRKLVEDFSLHGYSFILMDPEYHSCALRISFEGTGNGVWGMAYAKESYAVVYVETIRAAAQGTRIEDFLQGIANAAAHEMGHLLGFGHVDDPGNVMSVPETSSERFYENLEFRPRPATGEDSPSARASAFDDGAPGCW